MNRIGIPESEWPELLAYLKKTYKYEDGHIVNRKTGRRRQGSKMSNGYLGFDIHFKGKHYSSLYQRIVWILCNNRLPTQTIDHINGNQLDNRIENLREVSQSENNLNTLLPWEPDNRTKVTGVANCKRGFQVRIRGQNKFFPNPYEAFFWAIACGKRYKPTPSPSHCNATLLPSGGRKRRGAMK